MVTAEELERRRAEVGTAPDLAGLLAQLRGRAEPLARASLRIPGAKAQLSRDGAVCPSDGTPLLFDPSQPGMYRCPRCGVRPASDRHLRYVARFQHLWLAERCAEFAVAGILADDESLLEGARSLLNQYGERYHSFPNRDNVLGPSRLFFSTYLESIWLCNLVAAAWVLREGGALDEATADSVQNVVEEAANLIGEFDEGLSNRQTWHNAALLAAAVWFEDEELVRRAIEGRTGLIGHMVDGFGQDGLWYEGENYHLFALRGLLTGLGWARLAGVDLLEQKESSDRIAAALLAPALTALPDGTFPARRDARYGVSLAQPMYLELWEVGRARLRAAGQDASAEPIDSWLATLSQLPAPPADTFDSYLHEAGHPAPAQRTRSNLSWWALLEMEPEAREPKKPWDPPSTLLESQGLAVLRHGARYASMECGTTGGGHGHADRLHLTLHAEGVHWLPDPGTGSYVSPDLFWYRSTLAHNAPRLDGADQPLTEAQCEAFGIDGDWAWAVGRFGEWTRTLIAGPEYLLDLVEFSAETDRTAELAWHLQGEVGLLSQGRWEPADWNEPFIADPTRFVESPGPATLESRSGDARLMLQVDGATELMRATCPGLPNSVRAGQLYLLQGRGRYVRFSSLLVPGGQAATSLRAAEGGFAVSTPAGEHVHRSRPEGWEIVTPAGRILLRGRRKPRTAPLLRLDLAAPVATAEGYARHVPHPPLLDGTLEGFDLASPLYLDHEDQYRRSEEPYAGPEQFAAEAWINWDEGHFYLAVAVIKDGPLFRSPDAAPLDLDNEPDGIHSDGIQLYVEPGPGLGILGFLVVPDPRSHMLTVRTVEGLEGDSGSVQGGWSRTDNGYVITLGIPIDAWRNGPPPLTIGFDLLVNQAAPNRERRAGQLVWSGEGGWVYLRGDRQSPARFGRLEMA